MADPEQRERESRDSDVTKFEELADEEREQRDRAASELEEEELEEQE